MKREQKHPLYRLLGVERQSAILIEEDLEEEFWAEFDALEDAGRFFCLSKWMNLCGNVGKQAAEIPGKQLER